MSANVSSHFDDCFKDLFYSDKIVNTGVKGKKTKKEIWVFFPSDCTRF